MLLCTSQMLSIGFACSPRFITAAIEADCIPGLVHALRQFSPPPHSAAGPPRADFVGLEATLKCLRELLVSEEGKLSGVCQTAITAGVVPALINLLRVPHEATLIDALGVAAPLLMAEPCGSSGTARQKADKLLRAIAGLITATPPLAAGAAADTLFHICSVRRELIKDYGKWGVDDTVRRLSKQSHPRTKAAAKRLRSLVRQEAEVCTTHISAASVAFALCSLHRGFCTHPRMVI
jgi:hypothetical protein